MLVCRGVRLGCRIVFGAARAAAHAQPQGAHGGTRGEAEEQGRSPYGGQPFPIQRGTSANGGKASQQRSQSVWTAIATDFLESDTRTLAFTATTAPELRDLQDIAPLTQFRAEHLRWADVRAAEHLCLSEAVYYEARSETRSGQLAVADVVKNRVASKHYPNTICGVIYQGAENPFACQFSFACDGSMDRAPKGKAWDHSQAIAETWRQL